MSNQIYRQFEYNPDKANDPDLMIGEFIYVPNDLVVKMGAQTAFAQHAGISADAIMGWDSSNFYNEHGDVVEAVDEMKVKPGNYVEKHAQMFVIDMMASDAIPFHYRGKDYTGPAVIYHRDDWAKQVQKQTKVNTTIDVLADPTGTPLVFKDGENEVLRRDRGEAKPTIYLLRPKQGATLKPA